VPTARALLERPSTRKLITRSHTTGAAGELIYPLDSTQVAPHPRAADATLWGDSGFLRTAFVAQKVQRSVADLRNHINQLDVVFPDWFSWCTPEQGLQQNIEPLVEGLLASHSAKVLPLLSNVDNAGWHAKEVGRLLADPPAGDRLIGALADRIAALGADGINLDFESLAATDRDNYGKWIGRLCGEFHRRGLFVTVDVPLEDDDAYDYEAIGKSADAVVVMAYDEHFTTGKPGSIAGDPWVRDGIDHLTDMILPGKIILALGAFGYDWDLSSNKPAPSLSFSDVMLLARESGALPETESESRNRHFSYIALDQSEHEVWFLDAISAWNHFSTAQKAELGGVSLWRLGMEEGAVWDFLGLEDPATFQPAALAPVKPSQSVMVKGTGEIYRVGALAVDGRRELAFDGTSISSAAYAQLPQYALVEKCGRTDPHKLALTFDDGPDPTWTPQVLDVLRENHVQGTFFVVGERAEDAPDLVRREFAEGHLLGNHTYTHPHLGRISSSRLESEVDRTQRLIESITGRQTVMFRSPFDTDATPLMQEQVAPLEKVSRRGYWLIGAEIDSTDYEKPGAGKIVATVLQQLEDTPSNIVLFHDAGGDRHQTVEALRLLIPQLRARGYEFVTVDQLLGIGRDKLMPPVPSSERTLVMGNSLGLSIRFWTWRVVAVLFAFTTIFSAIRILFLGWLIARPHCAFSRRRKLPEGQEIPPPAPLPKFQPPVCVLVPAYNEGKVIRRTLASLLASDYPNFTVTVIDDGSTDNTARIVTEMAAEDWRITLLSQPNQGKSAALNRGFREASQDYIVTIDGDTIVQPHTISRLVEGFRDPSVDAVCGNVQVGNVNNLLTAFQNVEYVTSQNYDRRAFDTLNCISVVPGATGAWKREKVLDAGGYSSQTLTEDADLTLTLLGNGAKVVYAPQAMSITEAPQTQGALFRQRFRWSFGTFQCFWKHRRAFGRGSLGCVALPNMLLFQILFPILSPIGDFVLLASLFRRDLRPFAAGYLMFLAMDLIGSFVAFRLDRRNLWGLSVVLIQRFYYRQFMYVVTFASLLAALRGTRHGWNKLKRTGSVAMPSGPSLKVAC
jgi:cellulose synthase/poly-beta-1,6-N-acetylglucosamine synthase-like glycosyltransferase/peptidoglycan/xylan/chitin deacetylase (PgdA/CDA1 family)/spore germination protein YaaH